MRVDLAGALPNEIDVTWLALTDAQFTALVDAVIATATSEQHIIDLVGGLDPKSVESSYEGMLW